MSNTGHVQTAWTMETQAGLSYGHYVPTNIYVISAKCGNRCQCPDCSSLGRQRLLTHLQLSLRTYFLEQLQVLGNQCPQKQPSTRQTGVGGQTPQLPAFAGTLQAGTVCGFLHLPSGADHTLSTLAL